MKFTTSVTAATSITFYIHANAEGGASLVEGPFVLNIVCGAPSNPYSLSAAAAGGEFKAYPPVYDSAGKNTF